MERNTAQNPRRRFFQLAALSTAFAGLAGAGFGALKDRMLVRLRLDGEKVVREERLLQGVLGRIRDVRSAPDGYLYLLTDESDGVLARLEPAN